MRYFKKTNHSEIEKLWEFSFPLPFGYRDKELYLRVRKDGNVYRPKNPSYINSDELTETDIILE